MSQAHDGPAGGAPLQLLGVCQAFGRTRVLSGLSLAVAGGETHALIGPNGSGKTTLLNVISGWLRPQAGQVRFRGQLLNGQPPHRIARLGIGRASQLPAGFPRLTVREHLTAALQRGRGWVRFAVDELALRELAAQVGLEAQLEVPVQALAHGDQKRLELATALALQPALLLLDEPTAGLSPAETEAMIALLKGLAGLTVLVVEHDMAVVAALAQRVSVLVQGQVLAQGRYEEVAADKRVQAVYLSHAPG